MDEAPIGIRPYAGFQSSLPTDTIETHGEILQVGGKTVAEEIGKILIRLGADANEPVLEGENGWQFDVEFAGREMFGQVVHVEMFHLTLEDAPVPGKVPTRALVDLITRLADEMDRDPRFWDIRWYDNGGDALRLDDEPGSARPVQ
jgi:hypothetical protein